MTPVDVVSTNLRFRPQVGDDSDKIAVNLTLRFLFKSNVSLLDLLKHANEHIAWHSYTLASKRSACFLSNSFKGSWWRPARWDKERHLAVLVRTLQRRTGRRWIGHLQHVHCNSGVGVELQRQPAWKVLHMPREVLWDWRRSKRGQVFRKAWLRPHRQLLPQVPSDLFVQSLVHGSSRRSRRVWQ